MVAATGYTLDCDYDHEDGGGEGAGLGGTCCYFGSAEISRPVDVPAAHGYVADTAAVVLAVVLVVVRVVGSYLVVDAAVAVAADHQIDRDLMKVLWTRSRRLSAPHLELESLAVCW